MIVKFHLNTKSEEFVNITPQVAQAVKKSAVRDGICIVFCPHTTAGITINENADPDVKIDLMYALDKTYPDRPEFSHMEGNSAAHLKASVMGSSQTILIENGRLLLGTWQGIYFTEFDGPRTRQVWVQVMSETTD